MEVFYALYINFHSFIHSICDRLPPNQSQVAFWLFEIHVWVYDFETTSPAHYFGI